MRMDSQTPRANRTRGASIGKKLLGGLIILLLSDLLLSLVVPIVGYAQIQLVKNLFFPQPTLPDQITAQPTTATFWNGRLYASDTIHGTSMYDAQSGAQLGTIPGVVIGADAQYLYTSAYATTTPGPSGATNALSARDSGGRVVWSHPTEPFTLTQPANAWESQTPMQSDATSVYLVAPGTANGAQQTLLALDKSTGATRWSHDTALTARFTLAQGTLALQTYGPQAALTAISTSDGQALWSQQLGGIATALSTDGQSLYLLNYQGLRALAPQTGAQRWSVAFQPPTSGTPFLLDGATAYLLDASDQVIAISARDGHQLWRTPTAADGQEIQVEALIAARGGALYQVVAGPQLSAVDGASSHALWTTPLPAIGTISLVGAANGVLYLVGATACDSNGVACADVLAVDQSTGKLLWNRMEPQIHMRVSPVVSPAVALADQSLYLVGEQQRMQAAPSQRFLSRSLAFAKCSDETTLLRLPAATGAETWRHSATLSCSGPPRSAA